jgi:hypothetical protein
VKHREALVRNADRVQLESMDRPRSSASAFPSDLHLNELSVSRAHRLFVCEHASRLSLHFAVEKVAGFCGALVRWLKFSVPLCVMIAKPGEKFMKATSANNHQISFMYSSKKINKDETIYNFKSCFD